MIQDDRKIRLLCGNTIFGRLMLNFQKYGIFSGKKEKCSKKNQLFSET